MKRGLYRTPAVVLNLVNYGESDIIISFFTLEHGLIRGIAKGARRSRKRFVGALDPGTSIDLVFFKSDRGELARVEEASIIDAFSELKTGIERLSYACYLLELVSEMTKEGQVMPPVYNLLTGFLNILNRGGDPESAARFFEIRLLNLLGYAPRLDGCVVCRRPFDTSKTGDDYVVRFNSEKGGLVCSRCAPLHASLIPVSAGTVKLLSAAASLDTERLSSVKPTEGFADESARLLGDFIRFHVGKELKTKRFMEKMKGAL